jgi:hypothetical protein
MGTKSEPGRVTVMLDTEVLRRDPLRRGGAFRALTQLVHSGNVRLYLADVSLREFIAAQETRAAERLHEVEASVRRLQADLGADATAALASVRDALEAGGPEVVASVR